MQHYALDHGRSAGLEIVHGKRGPWVRSDCD
jgi:hypothetical protein